VSGIGDTLYRLVESYAGLGDHRTGTQVDDATRAWVGAELAQRGARVEEVAFDFPRYVATGELTAAGRPVPIVPLWYSGVGNVTEVEPDVHPLEVVGGYLPMGLDDTLAAARASGAPVVLATSPPDGALVAINREPVTDPDGPMAVLAPGRALAALAAGPTRLTLRAGEEPGRSATVVGRFGDDDAAPVVVTTPLTGWFGCAGERGTGVAVALELSAALARRLPVLVVGTTGHELGHLGARHWLGRGERLDARAVLHLGASVAAGTPGGDFSPLRFAMTTLDGPAADRVAGALGLARLPVRAAGEIWPGEGEEWRRLGVPVLSVTGAFPHFHTPDDVPPAVTDPVLLERVYAALSAAAAHLL
jgi:hypothetical protein